MTRAARVDAPAKINAFLHVGAREPSGFHEISTLFVQLLLADSIIVRTGGASRSLDCSGERIPAGGLGPVEKNLAYRAAEAYSDRAGWPKGFAIELTKNIPVGGGLGGGSSDAAAVLKALNALAPNPIPESALMQLGASLGSDVPFFVSGHPCALGTGRGEKLQPVGPLPEIGVLLVIPPFGVATADAYRWLDEDRPNLPAGRGAPPRVGDITSWDLLEKSRFAGNDFEPVVERRHQDLRTLREGLTKLLDGKVIAHLSGSGSTVFALFPPVEEHWFSLDSETFQHVWTMTTHRVVQVEVLQ
jgi:4-diphosphocytidyl-2-C-methyl-D-erythritol kinase